MSSLIVEVCKINNIEKHPKADRLRISTIKGWNCIIGLKDFNIGDLCIFCPPDSVIPDKIIDQYKLEYLKNGGRVRIVKLKGFISQGLVLAIPEGKNWKEGKDVAKEMGITKYEPPISQNLGLKGNKPTKKKRNPLFDKYTDIENVKNYNRIFNEDDIVVITEKIHGTNFRAGKLERYKNNLLGKILSWLFGKYEFVYGSHNVQLHALNKRKNFYGEDVYGQIAKKYNLADIIPEDYIVYGEIYGKGIQELEYGMKDIDVRFFDVKYKGEYLNWSDVVEFCLYRNLPTVPILAIENYKPDMLDKYTTGCSVLGIKVRLDSIREGCVIKSVIEENHPRIGRKILKSINPEYLLKKNRTEHH